ncbi:ATP-binding cassette domain-containing protein [Devosia neptuniae]|uniref:ATP-binding cassette domain-containing protein n=1 Tax=Devosia TaxID=46913 RepID=UPI0022B03127|nr:ATP-binding cassette domain-containing protein [Devosia neptuniae]MCZ4345422.1 ATP-binding cassette domain-containing protein [Devosia neptuniae]|tara:strand:+ start:68746 stop:70665 length:1920 start_codon:yes stop_codon:yes gene_type:complete
MVLRNGATAWRGAVDDVSIEQLVGLMGGSAQTIRASRSNQAPGDHPAMVTIGGQFTGQFDKELSLHKGEIIGLAGLEGHGQKDLLHAVFATAIVSQGDVSRQHPASFITGDRQKEVIFPLWKVLSNTSIGRIAPRAPLSLVSQRAEASAAASHADRLSLPQDRFGSNITELSGGNQQKALVARALGSGASILLLDDPTRGVDISTKQDFYRLCGEAAKEGRTLVWHTTEDAELLDCNRVLVFAHGTIVEELTGEGITEAAIVNASFAHIERHSATEIDKVNPMLGLARRAVEAAPFFGLIAVLGVMMSINPRIASVFGLDLLLLPTLSPVLVTIAKMFIVGGSEIDLGVGAFAGLTSVLAATVLFSHPWLGVLCIALAIAAYGVMGCLIQARKIPAIVVTLGASFIWADIGYSIQPTPGGSSPSWLIAAMNWSARPVPSSILTIIAAGGVGVLLDRSPLGVALRGFCNNASAMIGSGWSHIRFGAIRYLIAGIFAAIAGLTLTGINYSSDVNSGSSFTLISAVAASLAGVVLGAYVGGAFLEIGQPYLLQTIAAVVVGGTLIFGGSATAVGTFLSSVLLILIVTTIQILSLPPGTQDVVQGVVVIAVLGLAGRNFVPHRHQPEIKSGVESECRASNGAV